MLLEFFSQGKDLDLARFREIGCLADKRGFELAGFRSFERAVTEKQIARILEWARAKRG